MAVTGSKKTSSSFFSVHSLKKAIKKLVKKTRSLKEDNKKVPEKEAAQTENVSVICRVDFDAEIEDNLANEALEARLLQIIEASPATLDLSLNLKGTMMVKAEPEFEVQFGTFWTTNDDDNWSLCKELFAAPQRPVKA
ncbi:uncharacterized protein LOC135197562 [Macrobrachium nipponense]|uniref:uncharacterized protein LOC135197562 n=1 Tax=Macrobrachium nipponense TaxID=159736 RepID=UPI0030C7A700